tara:strand:- start:861 stop:2117 length:1257 start_codon:yes stop_codon:yes gene_type:complete
MADRKVIPQRDTLWLSGADAVNLVFGVIIHVVLTRALLSEEYGTFILLLDLFHVCVIIVDLGLPTLIGRDGERLGAELSKVLKSVSGIQAPLVFILGGALAYLGVALFGGWLVPAGFLALGAGMQVLAYSFRAALRALGEARWEAVVRIVDRGTVAVLMVAWAGDVYEFAIATMVGPIAAYLVAVSIYRTKVAHRLVAPEEPLPETSGLDARQLVSVGLPFLLASAALVVNVRVEKLLLGLLATPEDVAVFQIAWLGFIAGYGPILSLRAVLLSWFGEVRDDLERLAHRYKRAFIACAIICPVGALISIGIGPFAFDALFPEYAEAVQKPFYGLMLVWLFQAMASPSLSIIQIGKRPWNYTRILWAGIAIDILLCLWLIPTQSNPVIGAVGAACVASLFVFTISFAGFARSEIETKAE